MVQFFSAIGINIGKEEKKALGLRNKMVHGTRKYHNDEVIHNDLIYTRVYEVLFNRTLLKILDYDGYYVDYSMQRCPIKHISKEVE